MVDTVGRITERNPVLYPCDVHSTCWFLSLFSLDNIDVPLSVSIRSMDARVSNPQRHFQKKKKYCFIIYIRNRERGRINNWKDIFTGLPLLLGWEKHRNSVAKNEEGKERDRGRASLNREKMARDPCAQSQRLFCLFLWMAGRLLAAFLLERAKPWTIRISNAPSVSLAFQQTRWLLHSLLAERPTSSFFYPQPSKIHRENIYIFWPAFI